jgi:hypothetical protein
MPLSGGTFGQLRVGLAGGAVAAPKADPIAAGDGLQGGVSVDRRMRSADDGRRIWIGFAALTQPFLQQ